MKSASPALMTLLGQPEFVMADLYTFTLVDGAALYYTTADMNIAWGGNIFISSAGPFIDRGDCKWQRGLQVDTLTLDIYPAAANLVNGQTFLSAVRVGAFDGAELTLQRAFMPNWQSGVTGTVIIFNGRVAEIEAGRSAVRMTINSHLELLSQQMPRNLYTPGCSHTLFDSGCALLKAHFTAAGTVTGSTEPTSAGTFTITNAAPNGYYSLGTITFTSGANAGVSGTIKAHSANSVQLLIPLPTIPILGDAYLITAGCDKAQATCSGRFGNLAHYRGFPYIPVAETAQ